MIYLKDTKTGETFDICESNVEDFQDYYLNPQNLVLIDINEFEKSKLTTENGGIKNGTTR